MFQVVNLKMKGNKKYLLNKVLKGEFSASDDESLIWCGSLFQSLSTVMEKTLSPYVLRFALGSSGNLLFEELSVQRVSLYFSRSLIQSGASSFIIIESQMSHKQQPLFQGPISSSRKGKERKR